MNRRTANMPLARNRGFVLMAAVLLLGLVSMAVLLSSLSSSEAAVQQSLRTQLALKEAKEALLGYILLDAPGGGTLKPGSIPCPDRNNDNQSDRFDYAYGNCIGSVYTFRYPGKEFRTGELRDSANEKLWYAISPEFRVGSTEALNSSVAGKLKINGQGEYVAIVLAPGIALPGQRRSDPTNPAHFLEDSNSEGTSEFVAKSEDAFNDRLIGISKKEWEDVIVPRVFSDVARKIALKSVDGILPAAAPLSAYPAGSDEPIWNGDPAHSRGLLPARLLWNSTDWAWKNEWYKVIYYVLAPAYANGGAGNCSISSQCLTLRSGSTETKDIKALVIFAGPTYLGQTRSETFSVEDYLEGEENIDNDNVFELPAPGSTSNDRFYIIK